MTSTPPPEGDVSAPIASPTVGLGEEFPYQKLIKTVASTESSGQQRNDNEEKPEADVSLYDETSQKQYQSLSLKRNPTVRIFLTLERFFIFLFFFFLVDLCKEGSFACEVRYPGLLNPEFRSSNPESRFQ